MKPRGAELNPFIRLLEVVPCTTLENQRRDYPVRLSILQRRLIAGLAPEFSDRLKLSEQNQRVITLDVPEWTTIRQKVEVGDGSQRL